MSSVDTPPPSSSKNPHLDIENLRARLSFATTHRERATIEREMWRVAHPNLSPQDRELGHSKWIGKFLGTTYRTVSDRLRLYQQGDAAEALWERVDGPERMLMTAAVGVLTRAKQRATAEGVPLVDAVDRELAEYDTWLPRTTADGTYRKRPQRPRGFVRGDVNAKRYKPNADVSTSRDLWNGVRIALRRVVDHELRGLSDAHGKESLRSQIDIELAHTIQLLQSRVNHARTNARRGGLPAQTTDEDSAAAVETACTTLGVDPPNAGEHVGHVLYMAAKKNFKKLASEYHPDKGGDIERYRTVVESFRTIERNYQASANGEQT